MKMFKKHVSVVLAVLMIVSLVAIVPVSAESGIRYKFLGDGTIAVVNSYPVPAEIDGHTVSAIQYDPNSQLNYDPQKLTSIEIPDTVSFIQSGAFENTPYYNDENNWEDGVLYIGKHLIKAKDTISGEYHIKEGTLTIDDYAFFNCKNLTSVVIPDSVRSINRAAFAGCTNLSNIEIHNGTVRMGDNVLSGTAYYNNSQNWENDALYLGTTLMNVKENYRNELIIKDGTTGVAAYAMDRCNGITGVKFPESLEYLEYLPFGISAPEKLTNIEIPDSVTYMGESAFSGFYNLKSITIGSGVKVIPSRCFVGCYSLEEIRFRGAIDEVYTESYIISTAKRVYVNSVDDWLNTTKVALDLSGSESGPAFGSSFDLYIGDELVTDLVIPDSVTQIDKYEFTNCKSLKSVTIPESVTKINNLAFDNSNSITDIYYYGDKSEWEAIGVGNISGKTIHYNTPRPTEPPTTEEPTTLPEETTVPEAETTESVETTLPQSETTEPVETTLPESETTEPVETSVPVTEKTEPTTAKPTEPETDKPTEPATTEPVTGAPTEPVTTEPATDKPTEPVVTEPKPTTPEPTTHVVVSKKINPVKVTVKAKTVKLKKLKKKAQTVKAITVKNAQGKITYKLVKKGSTAKIFKLAKINSKGVITFSKWKKAKKGNYKLKVKITAAGNSEYKKKIVNKIVEIKIK